VQNDVGATLVVARFTAGRFYQSGHGQRARKRGDHKGRPYSGNVGGRRLQAPSNA